MNPARHGTVLVTGASGFVGQGLVLGLATAGWTVRAAARDVSLIPRIPGIEPVLMPDLAGQAAWAPLLAEVSHCVHLAGIAHSRAQIPEAQYHKVNAEAAGGFARAARIAGIKHFVLMSSVRAQSGPAAGRPLTELSAPAPTDAYGRSKLAAEVAVLAALGPAATVLRPVLVIGPGVKGNMAALGRLARLPAPLPMGGLRNRRSLLGLHNLCSAVDFALTAETARGRVFLVSDPAPLGVAELIAAMRTSLGRRTKLFAVPDAVLSLVLAASGRRALTQSLFGDLVADSSALTAAGWRPVSTTQAEISRMMSREP